MNAYYAVIMAGGGGTRLWPLSRQKTPKQALKLLGDRSLFEIAVDRLLPLFPPERILVVTSTAYAADLHAQRPQLPAENFIIEPGPRGTAPALGLAAVDILRRDPRATMACLTADHFMADEARFREVLQAAHAVAQTGALVTLGIAPTYPATGFGYIQRGEALGVFGGFTAYRAARFKEKPPRAEAEAMLADGLHAWNSGMFIWQARALLAEFARQQPISHAALQAILADPARLPAEWPHLQATTIDYGIMENANHVAVIPADGLGWNDVGSWEALFDVLPADEHGNIVVGADWLGVRATNSLVHVSRAGQRLVAVLDVQDLVIVDTDDILMVCPRDRAQDVRALVDALKSQNLTHWL